MQAFEGYEQALERSAKALIVFVADWLDPEKGVQSLWADSRQIHGLVLDQDAKVPEGFRVDRDLGLHLIIVPDVLTVVGRQVARQLKRTRKPSSLSVATFGEA